MFSGVIAEFDDADALLAAARRMREIGCRTTRAYSPFRVEGIDEALGIQRTRIPVFALVAALSGVAFAYAVMWLCNAYDYPLNVGGRPLNSVPTDVPIMFETAVLFSSITAFVLVIVVSGMPRLHHDMNELAGFERTSVDRFWLTVVDTDPCYGDDLVRELRGQRPVVVRVISRWA
jgi:hypothetical protein